MTGIPILFEDDEIFVINKRAGLSAQGGRGVAHPLDEELSRQAGFKVHLVHRLDKETCGLMVVAKNSAAAAKWVDLISSGQTRKEYTAVCFGEPVMGGKKCGSGTISSAVPKKNGRGRMELSASTDFTVEEVRLVEIPRDEDELYPQGDGSIELSKINLRLGTGRTHQIRIHLASVSCPVCGDDKHGNFRLNKVARKRLGIKNLLLCSRRLTIPSSDGKRLSFEIPLPDYFPM